MTKSPANDNRRHTPPVVTALRRSNDFAVLDSVRKWMTCNGAPVMAANDNSLPEGYQVECYMESASAEDLIAAYHAGTYHAGLHEEKFRRPRGPKMPPPEHEYEDAQDEMTEYLDRDELRREMGENAVVLDMACDGSTYRQIGEYFGHSGKYAERKGYAAVKSAAELFSRMAA